MFRFYPSEAKAIADKIVRAELESQVYDEEDAKAWSVDIGNKIREAMSSECQICDDCLMIHAYNNFCNIPQKK